MSKSLTQSSQLLSYLRKKKSGSFSDSVDFSIEVVIIVFQKNVFDFLVKENSLKRLQFDRAQFLGGILLWSTGLGAAHLIFQLEILRAQGAKKFVSFGSCGSFDPKIQPGEIFFAERALIAEGTSLHYQRTYHSFVTPILLGQAPSYAAATVVSTDAPFRETEAFRKTALDLVAPLVDMETSALYSFGEFYQIPCVAFLIVSDLISSEGWVISFLEPAFQLQIRKAAQQIFLAFQ